MPNHVNSSEFTWHRTNTHGFFTDVPWKHTFVSLSSKNFVTGFSNPEARTSRLHLYNLCSFLVLYKAIPSKIRVTLHLHKWSGVAQWVVFAQWTSLASGVCWSNSSWQALNLHSSSFLLRLTNWVAPLIVNLQTYTQKHVPKNVKEQSLLDRPKIKWKISIWSWRAPDFTF